jgi:hypothetical protein
VNTTVADAFSRRNRSRNANWLVVFACRSVSGEFIESTWLT